MKKSSMQHKNNNKNIPTNSNYQYSQQNQHSPYHNNLSSMGTNGYPSQSNSNMHMNNNGPTSFLPRISGASAFSNYTVNTGNPTSIPNKVKYI